MNHVDPSLVQLIGNASRTGFSATSARQARCEEGNASAASAKQSKLDALKEKARAQLPQVLAQQVQKATEAEGRVLFSVSLASDWVCWPGNVLQRDGDEYSTAKLSWQYVRDAVVAKGLSVGEISREISRGRFPSGSQRQREVPYYHRWVFAVILPRTTSAV